MSETQDNKLVTVSYLKKVMAPVVTIVKEVENSTANALTLPSGGSSGQIVVKKSGADGDVVWADLPLGNGGIICCASRSDFPAAGVEDTLYVAEDERLLYQWNPAEQAYEQIGSAASGETPQYTVIHGGNAAGE